MFRLSLFFLLFFSGTIHAAESQDISGKWLCEQSYETDSNMLFQSKYSVKQEKGSIEIHQEGVISLTSLDDSTKISKLEYEVVGTQVVNYNEFITTPIEIGASVIENSLGFITDDFLKQFTSNRETYTGSFVVVDNKYMTSTFANGNIVSCEKAGL